MELNEKESSACQQELESLLKHFDMIAGAVLSTQDGLLVAGVAHSNDIETDAIAAMSSSILSLADALAGQAGKPLVNNVISQAESSTLVILHAGELILTVVGRAEINVGLVLSAARRTAEAIDKLTKRFGEESREINEKSGGVSILDNPDVLLERIRKEMLEMKRRHTNEFN